MTHLQMGTLYIVGTPIGNLDDITFRALQTLKSVDLIAAEDTRHTGKLLHHFQIETPQISYHQHNQSRRLPELIDRLNGGSAIAIVTDAGMPGISDPGTELVQACIEAGVPVVPIPGVSACLTALSGSGLPTDRFVFEGFLPAKGKDRQKRLEALRSQCRTMILYESPHRLRQTLSDLIDILGDDHGVVIARELTKLHEEFWRGSLGGAAEYYQNREVRGELTIAIAPVTPTTPTLSEEDILAQLQQLLQQGLSRSQASRQLAENLSLSRRQIYQLALTLADQ
ncbi:16S rRNA (cytidine(1402)-2'-O)-methyltransferase [Limnospira fusiformis KN01]|uniref:Ribosomal RNA small subunit methyltransferase I n=1 Tax=Limnospira fusiformis PMC 851.14 TaxID=2219512 RepID=A0ABU9ELX2_LIMFS|nr:MULTISPECIES: 16S rRNA (cytidine(1402)-2'-O)-methyltransferase [Limnospira]MDY7054375.1 16S rRNA (cytidine(1402)-2'-O)-methyltransferase [Limnospira fusiformis LS22]QJB27048.1 16S rRNA (cytidine(1402)-2'-O)-methyltransferase [Limnospira fusiformis SAG 85.79]UWU49287.1 16S rRNA (cytidine1402-2'-O)-methyltransferase [Arthrospira platensis C1]MDT9188822.1 16S rRNA (cytidine(1402)-2'-O)-methyltransferase [Limnospira sp. PMC 894.15]MDT9193508.1 16S rRNA (cytidine(1402)-2'-O)-methyltransferase [L